MLQKRQAVHAPCLADVTNTLGGPWCGTESCLQYSAISSSLTSRLSDEDVTDDEDSFLDSVELASPVPHISHQQNVQRHLAEYITSSSSDAPAGPGKDAEHVQLCLQ